MNQQICSQLARHLSLWCLFCVPFVVGASIQAQVPPANYEEAKIPDFTLPDPFTLLDGSSVKTKADWIKRRRPEILKIFAEEMYGTSPAAPEKVKSKQIFEKETFAGKAILEEVDITIAGDENPTVMRMLICRPKGKKNVPAFLTLNFGGNHSISSDPDITLNQNWMRNRSDRGYTNNKATEKTRGTASSRWPLEMIVDRGYALATIYYGDIDPDFDDGFRNGVHQHFYEEGQEKLRPEQWGSIAGWAWGLSRGLDYLETHDAIDASRVGVMGHSRLGKTSLWAGANDERFAITISNNSGCGGAALNRRRIGESVTRINTSFPHWFCDNFLKYNHNEDELPVDQHLLVAAIAPRPVYIASAVQDTWADPKGEFLSARYADPVYRLLGTNGFGGEEAPQKMPEVDQPLKSGTIGYHIRSGKHDVTDFDWQQYLDFADLHLR